MAMGGLVTEVEVLSLTNAQLVLDLHRLRQERQHFEERCAGLQRERDQLHEQLNTTLPQTRLLTSQCAEHKLQIQALTLQVQQRKHLKTPAGRWVALSMLASRQDLDDDLHTQRKDFEEWMHDRREQLEQQSRLEQQKLLDRVEEKDKLVADLRHELRTEILLKEEQMSEVARMQSDRHLFDQGCQNDVSAAQSELTLALRSVKDLETQGSKEAEEYRRGLGVLQADLEMSSETLRAALSEAKGQLVSAKERNHRSHLQLSEKNTILERSSQQIVALQMQLQEANNKFLTQSMENGCLACRGAKFSGQPRP